MPVNRQLLTRVPFHRRTLLGSAVGALGLYALGALGARSATAQTPVPADGTFAERIGDLLALQPGADIGPDTTVSFYYADIQGQMQAAGVPLPETGSVNDLPNGYVEASYGLPLAAQAFAHMLNPAWLETFGFSAAGVHRTLSTYDPPNTVTVFAGGLDPAAIQAALERSGYARIEQETGGTIWTFGDQLDLESQVSRLALGAMNHAAFLGEAAVFAQQLPTLQTITQVAAGLAPSMLEGGFWPALVSLFPEDTVALVPVGPRGLGAAPGTVEVMTFGIRAGAMSTPLDLAGEGTPAAATPVGPRGIPATVDVRIQYIDADLAAGEAAAVPDRWREGQSLMTAAPLEELMSLEAAEVHPDDPRVVAVTFSSPVPNRYLQMIHTRDLQALLPVVG